MSEPANPPPEEVSGRHAAETWPDPALEPAPTGLPPELPAAIAPPGLRPAPEPLDVDVARLVLIGMAVWAVAFVALLPFRSRLVEDGHGYWLWTCVAGFCLGIGGYLLSRRAQRRR